MKKIKKIILILLLNIIIISSIPNFVEAKKVFEEPNYKIPMTIKHEEWSRTTLGNPHWVVVQSDRGYYYAGYMHYKYTTKTGMNYYAGTLELQPSQVYGLPQDLE